MNNEKSPEECIADAVDWIARKFHPLQILLFGSQARGDAKPDSDIDLIVVFKEVERHHRKSEQIFGVLADLESPKDVIVATPERINNRSPWTGEVLYYAMHEAQLLYHSVSEAPAALARLMLEYAESGLAIAARQPVKPNGWTCSHIHQCAVWAVTAALSVEGMSPPYRQGLIDLLGKLPPSWAGELRGGLDWQRVAKWRLAAERANAAMGISAAEAERTITQTQRLVETIEKGIQRRTGTHEV